MVRYCFSKIQQYYFSTTIQIIFVSVVLLLNGSIFSQDYNGWVKADSLLELREDPAIVKLPDGNILVSGGNFNGTILNTCEIYDVNLDQWRYTSSMNIARLYHNTILLRNNKVLAIGGFIETSCEIFDPETELWSVTDSFSQVRLYGQTITELQDGRVLLCGGYNTVGDSATPQYLSDCEIFDPLTDLWEAIAPMNTGRKGHTSTLLSNGNVLVTGGLSTNGTLSSCELYNPETNVWSNVNSLTVPRTYHAAILLPNGNVFVSGGSWPWRKSCEIYNVETNTWSPVNDMQILRMDHTMYLLPEVNELFIIGGAIPYNGLETWEKYDLVNMRSVKLGSFPTTKIYSKNSVLLDNNRIMLIGSWELDLSGGIPYLYISKTCYILDNITPVNEHNTIPNAYLLFQNYPNPFNPTTTISFSLPKTTEVVLKIFNILGQEITKLLNESLPPGLHKVEFNASNLSSGVYYYQFRTTENSLSKKMLLLK